MYRLLPVPNFNLFFTNYKRPPRSLAKLENAPAILMCSKCYMSMAYTFSRFPEEMITNIGFNITKCCYRDNCLKLAQYKVIDILNLTFE